jgi:hypothetical protein
MIFTNDFFTVGSTLPNDDLVQLVDSNTLEIVNYQKVTKWYHDVGPIYVDEVIIRKRHDISTDTDEYYALTSFLAGKPINIELFGAKGDSRNNDTSAFISAANFINNLPDHVPVHNPADPNEQAVFERPTVTIHGNSLLGYKIMDTISFEKPVNFIVNKIFYRGERDRTALIFKNSYKNTISTNVSAYQQADFSSDNFVGIFVQCAQHCKMHLGASFFTKGIVCEADGSQAFSGFAWNEIQLRSLQSNLDSFVIRNVNNGWANMNRVVGGEFGAFTGTINSVTQQRRRTFVKFEKDNHPNTKGCNSWLFLNQAFEWRSEVDPWETLCFDFSVEPCFGISIIEPRIESDPESTRAGIFHRGSEFNFESNQIAYTTDFTDQNGVFYVGEKPIVLLDDDLSRDFKESGIPYAGAPLYTAPHTYVKKLEPFNEYSGLFPNEVYSNHFCQIFKINDHNTNLWIQWYRYPQFVLFNDKKEMITDSLLLQAQIDLLDFRPQDYWIAPGVTSSVKVIKIGAEDEGDYINNIMSFIPEAKYIGIIQRVYDNARLKVMINRKDRGKIERVKFLGISDDTYATLDDPSSSNMGGFNFNTGEKFYNFNTFKTSVIKETGVGSSLSGYTVDATNGSRKFTVTGIMNNLSIGTVFYVNSIGSGTLFKITEKNGNVVDTNIPVGITLSNEAITFPICTYDIY